jgi:hypothetical protein
LTLRIGEHATTLLGDVAQIQDNGVLDKFLRCCVTDDCHRFSSFSSNV